MRGTRYEYILPNVPLQISINSKWWTSFSRYCKNLWRSNNIYHWVAAFDDSQTRHSWHLRLLV